MKELIVKLGHTKTTILVTLVSISSSVLVYLSIAYFWVIPEYEFGIAISIIIPLIITPILSSFIIKLFLQITSLEDKTRKLINIDSLTNLLSRNTWFDKTEYLYTQMQKSPTSLGLLYIDIDNFKTINDTYGHKMGDNILKHFGSILNSHMQDKEAFAGRLGGDEFIICLQDINKDTTYTFAQSLIYLIKDDPFNHNNIEIPYTLSIGITFLDTRSNLALDNHVEHADKALYQAKNAGRDQIAIYTD